MTQQEQIWQDVMELANRPGTFTHGLGLHVTGIGDGWAEGELTAGDGMLNPLGIVHGGVYAAMMDHVAGTAACSRGSTCRTVNYDLHYLAPAQPGLLRCRAESVRMGQQIVVPICPIMRLRYSTLFCSSMSSACRGWSTLFCLIYSSDWNQSFQ